MTPAAPGGALRQGREQTAARHIAAPTPLAPRGRRRRRVRSVVPAGVAVLAIGAWIVLASPLAQVAAPSHRHAAPEAQAETRVPAVAVRVAPGVRLFDVTGTDLGTVAAAPPRVPEVVVEPAALSAPTVLAALRVHRELPPVLVAEVTQIGATSPDGVWLRLRDGTRVEWGSAEDATAKAVALAALRSTVPRGRHATVDVSAAGAPAVSW